MSVHSFKRRLERGDRGGDVKAVKRALKRAGERGFAPTSSFGVGLERALKSFQRKHALTVDGVYGPATHAKLSRWFDDYAWFLYGQQGTLQLPEHPSPTHDTAGLPGYPATDEFAPGGTVALAPADGVVDRLSGHPVTSTTQPGGPYGLSFYLHRDRPLPGRTRRGRYFETHFSKLFVELGQHVRRGDPVGIIADYSRATNGATPSHVHQGFDADY